MTPPLRSMTGFARARHASGEAAVTVTLKSVNHRFLDLRWQAPAELDPILQELEKQVRHAVARGHLDIRCTCEREGAAERAEPALSGINEALVAAYGAAHAELSRRLHSSDPLRPSDLLRLPGVLAPAAAPAELAPEAWASLAQQALAAALHDLNRMRATEGAVLAADLAARLDAMQAAAHEIADLRAQVELGVRERLQQRMREALGDTPAPSPERLLQEAALVAGRSDISEELTRLDAHIGQARALLAAGGEAGKKLDFLAQELNREANTLLSKTTAASPAALRVAALGLELKAELEKFREQVQNLE